MKRTGPDFAPDGGACGRPQEPPSPTLPTPRVQLRWEKIPADGPYEWACVYELVLGLREHDIRREVWEDGEQVGTQDEIAVEISRTRRGTTRPPCVNSETGELFFDAPYRDGAHASWDAGQLGGLAVYVIAPDGTPLEQSKTSSAKPVERETSRDEQKD